MFDSQGELQFVQHDTRPELLEETGLAAGYVNYRLDLCRAEHQIVIIDSCYSGSFGRAHDENAAEDVWAPSGDDAIRHTANPAEHRRSPRSRVVIAATLPQGVSYEIPMSTGVTTPLVSGLLDGMRSGADDDGDGLISALDAYRYLERWQAKRLPASPPSYQSFGDPSDVWLAHCEPRRPATVAELPDVSVPSSEAREQSEHLAADLRRELETVRQSGSVDVAVSVEPSGSSRASASSMDSLMVTVASTAVAQAALYAVISTIRRWMSRRRTTVTISLNGQKIELSGASSAEQERLIEAFIRSTESPQ